MLADFDDNLDRPVLEIYLLGLVDFEDALQLQRRLLYEVSGSNGQLAALVLCEHPPVITVGRLGSRAHIECDDAELAARGISLRWVNRGGGCSLHLPGQLVAYPIVPFRTTKVGMAEYLRKLERSLLKVLHEFSIRGRVGPRHTGIWTASGQIASIAIAMSRWVAYHGVALNVAGTRDWFRLIHPEGNGSLRATTMEAERQRPAPMARVRECFVRKFIETFQLEHYNLYTHHPMLDQSRAARAYVSSV